MTASEQATIHFYNWENQHRGYYHFDTPVDIEVSYAPFRHGAYSIQPVVDDGRVPSLFKSVMKLLSPPIKQEKPRQEKVEIEPHFLAVDDTPQLVGLSLLFPKETEILSSRNREFLNMLSFTEHLLSFEIIGSADDIRIQIVCSEHDKGRISSHLQAYFPTAIVRDTQIDDLGFCNEHDVAIADFGVNDEFVRPIATTDSFGIDPLTSVIAIMESLGQNDVAVFQILFKGITSPLAKDISYSVSDGDGGSFFADAPEMLKCAQDKISNPLFSVVMRIAAQGVTDNRSQYIAQELARSISTASRSEYNKLIPLSNKGYDYDFHKYNLHYRLSNRLGFILNSSELNTFVHFPNKTVISKKLGLGNRKTKKSPLEAMNQKYVLGINEHNGEENQASISDEVFSKHIVIGGASGTGKTHLIKQLICKDLELHNSAFALDPHGDLTADLLNMIPERNKDDVVYINIADEKYSFGFNIFSASTDAEKTVLASDLASAFADSWISSGDRIQSVLQKTISTFVYSTKEASLLDFKRFLLEQDFRNEFLQSLDDPILQYYWKHEFPLVRRNELSPLLLRIDSFMQTRLLRNIFCQTKGIDFKELINQRKLVLIQLSVGLIGLENSKFLARLIISKINQIAFSRQQVDINERFPIHLYIDESSNYANSPVIEQILSGARKYNLNLVLVLQHLEQVQKDLLNSILTNTSTQIFFRQSDKDAKRVSSSFSFFEAEDFMELDRGEALVRISKRSNDFNLKTLPLPETISNKAVVEYIIQYSRIQYAKSKEQVFKLIERLLPQPRERKEKKEKKEKIKSKISKATENIVGESIMQTATNKVEAEKKEAVFNKKEYLEKEKEKEKEQEVLRKHRAIQNYIKTMAQQRGFVARIEEELKDGGRVDVGLTQNDIRIAVEVSVTNSINYEIANIEKCLLANYDLVFLVSESVVHRNNIERLAKKKISKNDFIKTFYLNPNELATHLNALIIKEKTPTKKINGWRVNVNYHQNDFSKEKQNSIKNRILKVMKKDK